MQRSAIVLASLVGPAETFLFLSSLNRLGKVIASLANYQIAAPFADAFIGLPPTAGGHEVVIPKQNLLILGPNKPMSFAVKTGVAEPGAMRRDDGELARTGLTFKDDEVLVSCGGWLDHLSPATYMHYPSCEGVDFAVHMVSRNQGLHAFQRQAIRAVIDVSPGAFKTAFDADKDKPARPWAAS